MVVKTVCKASRSYRMANCDFCGGSNGKESACKAGDSASNPESRSSPGAGNGYPH